VDALDLVALLEFVEAVLHPVEQPLLLDHNLLVLELLGPAGPTDFVPEHFEVLHEFPVVLGGVEEDVHEFRELLEDVVDLGLDVFQQG